MRTTVDIPDDLLAAAKRRAAEQGTTLTALVGDALRAALGRVDEGPSPQVRLTVWGEGGLRPGVDLDDTAALLDLMEGPDDGEDGGTSTGAAP